jgi:hypothetical protein
MEREIKPICHTCNPSELQQSSELKFSNLLTVTAEKTVINSSLKSKQAFHLQILGLAPGIA